MMMILTDNISSLVCAVEAFPPAQVTWIHANIQKSDNEDNVDIYRGQSYLDNT